MIYFVNYAELKYLTFLILISYRFSFSGSHEHSFGYYFKDDMNLDTPYFM
jgi:hypothetical protein